MNERIEELIEQADNIEISPDEEFCDTDFLADIDPRRVKKFAELIVNRMIDNVECHADLYDSPDIKFICEKIVNSIKFDFGVEE